MATISRAFTMADVAGARQLLLDRSIQYQRDKALGNNVASAEAQATVDNLNPVFAVRMANAVAAAEEATGAQAIITEQWRSDATQAVYYANRRGAPVKHGGVTYAPDTYQTEDGKTVTRKTNYPTARPGHSNHREGEAVDFSAYGAAGKVRSWIRSNAASLGMRTIRGDDPHIEANWDVPLTEEETQFTLNELGYSSVEEFQKANKGLTVDGVVGPATTKALMGKVVERAVTAAADPANKPYTIYSSDVIAEMEKKGITPGTPGSMMVAGRAPIELSPADRDIAIRTIIGEAGGEGEAGETAVAHVIANRFDQGYGPSVAAIAGDESQFDAWNHDQVTAYNPGDPEYDRVAAIVDNVFTKRPEPPAEVGNATEFYSGAKEPGYWGKGAVAKVGQIGGHVFGAIKDAVARPKGFMLRQTKGGEADPRAAALQKQLVQAGIYKGEVDGRYGPQTTAAVKTWQQKNGMRATGIADGPTLRSLRMPASEAGFARMFMVNPETPANRAKLFPDGAPKPATADTVEEVLNFDPLELLRDGGGTDTLASKGSDGDRLGDQISDSGGGDVARPGAKVSADRLGGVNPPTPRPRPDRPAPASAEGLRTRIRRNDTFGLIAKRELGDASRWPEIAKANPGMDPRKLQIGAEIVIPGASGPPTPRDRPDPAQVERQRAGVPAPGPDSGPSLETIRSLGLTESVWDNVIAKDPALNAPEPPAPSPPDSLDYIPDYLEKSRVAARTIADANYYRPDNIMQPPPASAPAGAPEGATDVLAGGDRTGARVDRRATTPPETLAEIDQRLDQLRNMPDMNRTGGEAWGESYESDPTLLTDIGLYDQAPEEGRSPANLSLDAMGTPEDRTVTHWADGMGAYRPANQRTQPSAKGLIGNAVAPNLDSGSGRQGFIDADPAAAAIDSTTGTWDDLPNPEPRAAPAPPPVAERRPTGATITVNGTEYQYDGNDAINDMLGLQTAETMNYADDGSGVTVPKVNIAGSTLGQDDEITPPSAVDALAAAGAAGGAPKSPGAITAKPSTANRPYDYGNAGGNSAPPGQSAPQSTGITSPQNPNFTGTGVEVNPITGETYAIGTWSNGARAIGGDGWTAVENHDGTFSYAGNPLSNASLGSKPT